MRKKIIVLLLIIMAAGYWLPLSAQAPVGTDEKLLQEAKVLIFDKNWSQAEKKLATLIKEYPGSNYYSQALFYLGKCQAEQDGKEKEALKTLEAFLQRPDRVPGLVEEAEIAMVDLAFKLYNQGQKYYGRILQEKLASQAKVIRYYAAMKMSYLQDKNLASKALPVLLKLLETERDQELVDRARIAILRISPQALKDVPDRSDRAGLRLLRIRVYERGKKIPSISINLPMALADLAIQAIPEEEKARMKDKGYDLNRIISDLVKAKEKLVRIEEDGNIIEIWIE
ncbi:MAG: tetratricopeptide repeat protein [Candidatus Saccharicenans sp.]|uniref:tetratricopeptide repeat protein n=1 Tax=Candidatus Saccharicenans sp. TaxID=2819258 RepID=UPI0040492C37